MRRLEALSAKIKCLLIILSITLFLSGCENWRDFTLPDWVHIPSWEVNLKLTLVDNTYRAVDLTSGINFEVVGNEMCFVTNGTFEGITISQEQLRLEMDTSTGENSIPLFPYDIPPTRIKFNTADLRIQVAEINSGNILFLFSDNIVPEIIGINIKIEGIYPENGNRINIDVTREDINNGYYSYKLGEPPHRIGRNNTFVDSLYVSLSTSYDHPNPVLIPPADPDNPLNGHGLVRYYFGTYEPENNPPVSNSPIDFEYIRGIIGGLEINAEDSEDDIDIDYPPGIEEAIDFRDPRIEFYITNAVGFTFKFSTKAKAINDRVSPPVEETQNIPGGRDDPADWVLASVSDGTVTNKTIRFDKSDGIDNLLNVAPNKVEITNSKYELATPNQVGFARLGETINGEYKAIIPFDFKFYPNVPIRLSDSPMQQIEIAEADRKEIEKNIDKGEDLTFDIFLTNNFGITTWVDIFVATDSLRLYVAEPDSVSTDFRRLFIPDNLVTRNTRSHIPVVLTDLEKEIFYKREFGPYIYMGLQFTFAEGGTIVRPEQSIHVLAGLRVRVKVDPNDVDKDDF